MSPIDAAKLLELPDNATPEQIEARFQELRAKLEEKIGKAPTPGLKAKYRESLEEITSAFETLTLAADSSALPVLKREAAKPTAPAARGAVPSPRSDPSTFASRPSTSAPRKSSGKEFAVVAVIAVVLLALGGWWVMKTKAENEEKARIAAEAKAEAERQAQLAKEQAEKDRLAKEAADKAEKERQERLFTQLRGRLAELNVAYEAQTRLEQAAERELNEFKSQARELARDNKSGPTPELRRANAVLAAQERYTAWLRDTLPSHPAKIAKARAEELVSARAGDDAATAVDAYTAAVEQLRKDIAEQKAGATVTGEVVVESNVRGASWRLTDGFGVTYEGVTPARLGDVGVGRLAVEFTFQTFPAQLQEATLAARGQAAFRAEFNPATVRVRVSPAHATVTPAGEPAEGAQVYLLGPGLHVFKIEAPGYASAVRAVTVGAGERRELEVKLDDRPAALLLGEAAALVPRALQTMEEIGDSYRAADCLPLWAAASAAIAGRDEYAAVLDYAVSLRWPQGQGFRFPSLASSSFQEFGYYGHDSGPTIALLPKPEWFDRVAEETKQRWNQSNGGAAAPPAKSPLDEAISLLIAGKDPLASGLRAAALAEKADRIVGALIRAGRTDLAYDWMRRAAPLEDRHQARLRSRSWMGALLAAGRVDEAIALFEVDQARLKAADPDITYFVSAIPDNGVMPEMVRVLRHRADRAGLDKLAALIRRTRSMPDAPREALLLKGDAWRHAWLDPLQRAGLTPQEAQFVEQSIALADNSGAKPAAATPASRRPAAPGREGGALFSIAETIAGNSGDLPFEFNFFRHFMAKILITRGQPDAALQQIRRAPSGRDNMMKALAFTHASLGNWDAATHVLDLSLHKTYDPYVDASNPNVIRANRFLRVRVAQTLGIALAERWEEKQALAVLRGISDPLDRVHATCTYLLRQRELEAMTPEQREFLRTLPPL